MPDQDGYPTEDELRRVREWESTDWHAFMEFVKSIWWMPDWGFNRYGEQYEISTGGWSGNEDIIEALKESKSLFWLMCWRSSRRGGHFTFEVARILPQEVVDAANRLAANLALFPLFFAEDIRTVIAGTGMAKPPLPDPRRS